MGRVNQVTQVQAKPLKLKIFSDQSYLPNGAQHWALLYPFWGYPNHSHEPFRKDVFRDYGAMASSSFELTDIDSADVAVLPNSWRSDDQAMRLQRQFAQYAYEHKKRVIIFRWRSNDAEIPFENAIVFSVDLYKSRRRANEFAMPTWAEDLAKTYLNGQIQLRQKNDRPVVGFCGYAPPLAISFGSEYVKDNLRVIASQLGVTRLIPAFGRFATRARAIKLLEKNEYVQPNFITRDHFAFDGRGVLLPGGSEEKANEFRHDFVNNMLNSDYILCARGGATCSIRLYETLSCGRIPIFIDTDCVLPFDFAIDWRKYCIWVTEKELPHLAKKVRDFHENISARDFVDLQRECRQLYDKWLAPESFFANLYKHL